MACCFAGLLLATCSALMLAYLYGTPLLYGGSFVPPAATTSLAFAALGMALVAVAGPQAWPSGEPGAAATRPAPVLFLVFFLLAVGIITAGYLYFRSHAAHYRTAVARELSSVAELKAAELAQYRRERLGDGSILFRNAAFSALLQRVLDNPADGKAQAELRIWLGKVQAHYQYDRVFLLGAQGAVRMSIPEAAGPIASVVARGAAETLRSGEVALQDFYRDEHDQRIYLAVLVPILGGTDSSGALGVIVLRIDPKIHLYPFISRWPRPSETAETLLVRRDGKDALFLNELRFKKGVALTLRIPLEKKDVMAVAAVLGQQGIAEGLDYRGEAVIADVRAIPDSTWFLVSRMDVSEVNAPLRERMWITVAFVVLMLVGSGAGVGSVWRQQHAHLYRERHEAERRRLELFDNVPIGLYRTAADGEILAVNPAAVRILGYVVGQNVGELYVEPSARQEWLTELGRSGGVVEGYEMPFRRSDGRVIWVRNSARGIRDSAGEILFYEGALQDITAERQAAAATRESEDRYRLLVEASPVGIIVHAEGEILYVNPAAVAMIGARGPENLLGRALTDFVHPDFRSSATERMRQAYAQEVAMPLAAERLIRLDGEVMDVEVTVIPIVYSGTKAVQVIINDVTGRKHAEKELALRDAALAAAANAVMITDKAGKIVWVNPAFTKVTGYTSEEAVGGNPRLLKSGVHDRSFYEHLWKTIGSGQVWSGEIINRRKDGTLYTEEQTITPVPRNHHFIAIKQDVTARKQAERDLRQALAKAEESDRLKRAFLANMSHEVRTPLNVISGFASLIDEHLQEIGDHSQDELFEGLCRSSERLIHTMHGLLDLASVETGTISVTPERIELSSFLREQIDRLTRTARNKGLSLGLEVEESSTEVTFDPYCLKRVVENLLDNAIKFTEQGGVTVRVHRDESSALCLSVGDTGVGVDPSYMPRLFDRFSQEESGYTRRFEGAGVGLALVQRYVEMNQAEISFQSEKGAGTTFTIRFAVRPIAVEDGRAAAATLSPSAAAPQRPVILVVEDDDLTQSLLAVTLRRDFDVLFAAGAKEARAHLAARSDVAVVLLDLSLKGDEDGLMLARWLRSEPRWRDVPVIATTAHAMAEDRENALEAGCTAYLAKPTSRAELLSVIRRVLFPVAGVGQT